MMTTVNCYLYKNIPGTHASWTLAVFATSRNDADEYIKCNHRGGLFSGKVFPGKVNANCGATTESAREVIARGLP